MRMRPAGSVATGPTRCCRTGRNGGGSCGPGAIAASGACCWSRRRRRIHSLDQRTDALSIGVIVVFTDGLGLGNRYRAEEEAEAVCPAVHHETRGRSCSTWPWRGRSAVSASPTSAPCRRSPTPPTRPLRGPHPRCESIAGLRNLPLNDFAQNQICNAVVLPAEEFIFWVQMLALTGTPARTWEANRLRHRLFSIAEQPGRRKPPNQAASGRSPPRAGPDRPDPSQKHPGQWNPTHRTTPGPQTYPPTNGRPKNRVRHARHEQPSPSGKMEGSEIHSHQ